MAERFARVIVDLAVSQVDRTYTYSVPQDIRIEPGMRVMVPFGGRKMEGFVLDISSECDVDSAKVKSILSVLEAYPVLLPPLIDLAKSMAVRYHCTLAQALRLMIPSELRGGRVKIKTEQSARLLVSPENLAEAKRSQGRSAKRKLLLDLLSDGESHWVSDLRLLVRSPLDALRQLQEQGLIELSDMEIFRRPRIAQSSEEDARVLTPGQKEALSELLPAVEQGKGAFLLRGITGSGKTEVYIRCVKACLAAGKGAIVLVPEIVLTPQMVSWFHARFGEVAAVLHSRLSPGERYDEWRRVLLGDARVVIGARSAVFAPVSSLGLIVVDEEHEQSYQSESTPQYDAREVAKLRTDRENAVLLLASATPSVLSFAMAGRGDLMLLEMPERVHGNPLPKVTVVDMREELRLGNKGMFSYALTDALNRALDRGEQAMLFVNRRGYASSVVCRKCGHALTCDQCDVSLTYHQADKRMHCHYCGQTGEMPEACPECGSRFLKTVGVGTQRVEEEVLKLFPKAKTVRMDIDTTQGKDGHLDRLNIFRSGAANVMIGTQMIAKGLDFPNVTLVGAVLADISLNLPDYRSAERTFQLLTQVAGRAGRDKKPGEVIIQSYKPEHYAIMAAARQDYRAFFQMEFARRRKDLYPPFTMMLRVLCTDDTEEKARAGSRAVFERIREELAARPQLKKRVLFYREDESPIRRLMGKYRAQVLLKVLVHPDSDQLIDRMNQLVQEEWPCQQIYLEINPASLA